MKKFRLLSILAVSALLFACNNPDSPSTSSGGANSSTPTSQNTEGTSEVDSAAEIKARHDNYIKKSNLDDGAIITIRGKLMGFEHYANNATTINAYLQEDIYGYWVNNFPCTEAERATIVGKSFEISSIGVGSDKQYPGLNAAANKNDASKGYKITELTTPIEVTELTVGAATNVFADSRNAAIKYENAVVDTVDTSNGKFTFKIGEATWNVSCNGNTDSGVKDKIATMTVGQKITSLKGHWYHETEVSITNVDELVLDEGEESVAPESITLSETEEITLKIEERKQLTATVSPAGASQKVTWSSSNEAAATISDKGIISAVAAGETTITVKSVADETKTASVKVTVTNEKLNYGTENAPLSVAEAVTLTGKQCFANNEYTKQTVYVTGVCAVENSYFYLVDTNDNTKKIELYSPSNKMSKPNGVADPAGNDTLTINGYITIYNGTIEFTQKDNNDSATKYKLMKNERGTSKITLGEHTNATITGIEENQTVSKVNGSEFTITVTADSGLKVFEVKANDTFATKGNAENEYKFTVAGDTVITVTTIEENIDKYTFENYKVGTDYKKTIQLDDWTINKGNVSSNKDDQLGSKQCVNMRAYDKDTTFGSLVSKRLFVKAKSVEFKAKYYALKAKLTITQSTDCTTWTNEKIVELTDSAATYTYNVSTEGKDVYLKFEVHYDTNPTKTGRVSIDDIVITRAKN